MDLTPGYDLSEAWIMRLRLLGWIYDEASGQSNKLVACERLTGPAWGYTAEEVVGSLRDFTQRGWIALAPNVSVIGIHDAFLLPAGVDLVERVRRVGKDPVARRKAARDALLRWLYRCTVQGQSHPTLSNIHRTSFGYFYGEAFSQQEIEAASNWLAEKGLIRGTGTWGGGIPRPSITTRGESIVEEDASVNDPDRGRQAGHRVTVTGDNNTVTTGSPHASVQVSITQETRDRVLKVAEAVERAAGVLGLDPADEQRARGLAQQLRDEVAVVKPDTGKLRQLLGAAQRIVVSGTGAALGEGIAALCGAALGAL